MLHALLHVIKFSSPIMDTWFVLTVIWPPNMQMPAFYQQPPGPGVVPWPQATSPGGYFETAAAVSAAGNFVHFVNNPPQQAFAGKGGRGRGEGEGERSHLTHSCTHVL